MGYKTIMTDHSLFSYFEISSVTLGSYSKFIFTELNHAITVSHTGRENFYIRNQVEPMRISAIPNAVDTFRFTPDPSKRFPLNKINIVIISRLCYRKGTDLLVDIIPPLC